MEGLRPNLSMEAKFRFCVNLGKLFKHNGAETKEVQVGRGRSRMTPIHIAARLIKLHLERGGAGPAAVWWDIEPRSSYHGNSHTNQVLEDKWIVGDVDALAPKRGHAEFWVGLLMHPANGGRYDRLERGATAIRTQLYNTGAIYFNENSSYHVTVGNGDAGFDIRHIQYLYTLLLLGGESILHTVHPPHRHAHEDAPPCSTNGFLGYGNDAMSIFCDIATRPTLLQSGTSLMIRPGEYLHPRGHIIAPPGELPRLQQIDHSPPERTKIQMKYIWRADKAADFRQFFSPIGHDLKFRPAYSVYPKGEVPRRLYCWDTVPQNDNVYSVEFREGDGYLLGAENARYPVMWAKVAVGLLSWATQVDDEAFWGTINDVAAAASRGYDQEGEMIGGLLQRVGLSEDVIEFMQARAQRVKAEGAAPELRTTTLGGLFNSLRGLLHKESDSHK